MRVLVGYASKHGGTREIAERIAARIRLANIDVEVRPLREVTEVAPFDAFVLGSSIYMGRWDRDAVAFVGRHREVLRGRPVWLFSSGPLGTQPRADPAQLPELGRTVPFRAHKVFGGVLKQAEMSLPERLLARAMKVSGDYREWDLIEGWADDIRAQLEPREAPAAPG